MANPIPTSTLGKISDLNKASIQIRHLTSITHGHLLPGLLHRARAGEGGLQVNARGFVTDYPSGTRTAR